MNFFFDNMMSPKLAKMIQVLCDGEHCVCHVRDDPKFGPRTEDRIWVTALAGDSEPWCVISGDLRMLGNSTIIAEFHQSQLVFFCMDHRWCSGNTNHSQVWKFFRVWPDIVAFARGNRPAFYQVNTIKDRPTVDPLRLTARARRRRLRLE
jgi:hypothetical protein